MDENRVQGSDEYEGITVYFRPGATGLNKGSGQVKLRVE